jgi:hypothetical protein
MYRCGSSNSNNSNLCENWSCCSLRRLLPGSRTFGNEGYCSIIKKKCSICVAHILGSVLELHCSFFELQVRLKRSNGHDLAMAEVLELDGYSKKVNLEQSRHQ